MYILNIQQTKEIAGGNYAAIAAVMTTGTFIISAVGMDRDSKDREEAKIREAQEAVREAEIKKEEDERRKREEEDRKRLLEAIEAIAAKL